MKNYPRLSRAVRVRKEGDDWLVLTPGGRLLSVNTTGKLIIELCNGENSIDDIAKKLAALNQSPGEKEIKKEIGGFLTSLEIAKCIDFAPDKYQSPAIEVVLSTGKKKFSDVDPEHFLSFMSADPPCQA
jgi:hypothetical protein